MAGWYELKVASNGQHHFNLKAGNGEIILQSELYVEKRSALAGIASVQKNCSLPERYRRLESSNEKWYFTLTAGNHQVIGKSQMYASEASRDAGIQSVMTNGVTSDIREIA